MPNDLPQQDYKDDASARQQEAKYRALFDSIDEGVAIVEVLTDQQGRVVDMIWREANPGVERQAGISGWVGKRASEMVPHLEQAWLDAMTSVYQTGEPVRMEAYIADLDRWIETYYSRVGEAGSSLMVSVFRDITERKQQEQRQELVISIAQELGQLTDETQLIRSVGTKLAAHLGLTCYHYVDVDEASDQVTVSHFWHALEVPPVLGTYPLGAFVSPAALAAWRAGKPTIIQDMERDMSDETPEEAVLKAGAMAQKISAFIAVGLSQEGKWKAYFAVADSRPRAWTNSEIELIQEVAGQLLPRIEHARAEEALRKANRRKDEFLAMLAHELRNPMATIHNTLLLLKLTQGQDETLPLDRGLEMMSREVNHLNRMVDDLLDVSRISQGKIQLKKERLDLSELIHNALEATRSEFVSRGQILTTHLSTKPLWVEGDRTRLTQVVRNLTTNALIYTPAGGLIEVHLASEVGQAVLRVGDTGIGLAPDQLEAIFETFVQISSSLDRPQGGWG